MDEREYYEEVVAKRQQYEKLEQDCCKGCRGRFGVPCLKVSHCEILKKHQEERNEG